MGLEYLWCFREPYSLLKMQVCWRVYWLLVTFHTLTVPSLPLVASRPFLLHQPHVMTWVKQRKTLFNVMLWLLLLLWFGAIQIKLTWLDLLRSQLPPPLQWWQKGSTKLTEISGVAAHHLCWQTACLTDWGKKLFCSLMVKQRILLYLLLWKHSMPGLNWYIVFCLLVNNCKILSERKLQKNCEQKASQEKL